MEGALVVEERSDIEGETGARGTARVRWALVVLVIILNEPPVPGKFFLSEWGQLVESDTEEFICLRIQFISAFYSNLEHGVKAVLTHLW